MLEPAQVLAYIMALGLAAAIPGPGMTALVARSVSGGALTGFTMLAGIVIGDLIYLSLAVFGLAIVAHTYSAIFSLITLGAIFYLGWLSWQFWNHNPQAVVIDQKISRRDLTSAWLSGLTITLGNPKTIAFYMALLPLVITLDTVSLQIWAFMLVPLTIIILLIVGAVFILGALKIRYFLTSTHAQRWLFRSVAIIMLAASLGMLWKML